MKSNIFTLINSLIFMAGMAAVFSIQSCSSKAQEAQRAEASLLQKFYHLNSDTGLLGLAKQETNDGYFCTPVGAEVFARLGVDGIHFCFIPSLQPDRSLEQGMVYAVNPMAPDQYVKPVANNLKEFLEMVIACGDAGVLEQAGAMDRKKYDLFMEEVEASAEMKEVIDEMTTELELKPEDNLFDIIHSIQEKFDYNLIPFSEEYYETTGIERE
ncbi:MAG: hypothetical protein Q4F05_06415 [bacterium]|nr:hypothetical protein [bacterium]